VVLPHGLSVAYGNQCDSLVLHVLVDVCLDVDAHLRGALIHDRVDRLVVQQATHSDTLLLSSTEHLVPIVVRVPSVVPTNQVVEFHLVEDALQVLIRNPLGPHVGDGMRIDNLVTESALREVGTLRDVEDLVNRGLVDLSTEEGPELTENAEERALTATVRPSNEEVHPRLNAEVHGFD